MKIKNKSILFLILGLTCIFVLTACGIEAGDKDDFINSNEEIAIEKQNESRQELLNEADKLMKGYFYDEAIALINSKSDLSNGETQAKIDEINIKKSELELYTGNYYHVFFHSLILDNELAFSSSMAKGYDLYMTTRNEFIKMLPLLEEKDFVLVDLNSLAKVNLETKDVELAPLYLPKGKKPLIISIDDVCYYPYMKGDGFADRLVVDDKGKVATVVINREGKEEITYDGDVMPILDSYVEEHPEFSYRGAKGTVAVTGYAGAFGYRITDLEGEELEEARNQVKQVSEALRNTGWQIASHSYTHNQYFKNGKITMAQLKYDTERWKNLIEPYVGETHIFISPFGATLKGEFYKYMEDQGYYIYCPVGSSLTTKDMGNSLYQPRVPLDGETLKRESRQEFLTENFFNPKDVLDPDRPK